MRWLCCALALLAALTACQQPKGSSGNIKTTPVPVWGKATWAPAPTPTKTPIPVALGAPTPGPAIQTSGPTPVPHCSPFIAAICTDPPPIGNQNGVCNAGNGNGNQVIGQPCAATPTPPPAATAPPLRAHQSWMGENGSQGIYSNHYASAAQLSQYDDLCIGFEDTTAVLFPTQCPGYSAFGFSNGYIYYNEWAMGQPNTSGHDVDDPFNGGYANRTGATCNAAATNGANFWNQQTPVTIGGVNYSFPDYTSTGSNNWFNYVAGGTTGDVHFMGAGWSGSSYYFYLNMNSASLLAYTNDVIANCAHNATYASNNAAFDNGNMFKDNTQIGFQSQTWDMWDGYPTGKNFGTGTTATCGGSALHADPTFGASGNAFVPSNFFNAACHGRSTLITTTDTTTVTYPVDTSYRSALVAFMGSLKHSNGTPELMEYNGFTNTDMTAEKADTNIRFPVAEEYLVGCFGACPNPPAEPYNGPTQWQQRSALGTDLGMKTALNNLAAQYQEVIKPGINSTVSGMFLADSVPYFPNATTTTQLGTGTNQQDQLWEYAPIFAGYADDAPDDTAEFSNVCGLSSNTALTGANCMDVWPFDFIMPSGRITPYMADPSGAAGAQPCGEYSGHNFQGTGVQCTTGGAYDTANECASTPGLFCEEFQHLWAFEVTGNGNCTTFDVRQYANCAIDIGPFAVIIDFKGGTSGTPITAANISSWLPHVGSQLTHVLVPCTPTSAYWGSGSGAAIYAMPQSGTLGYGTAQVCSGNSGFDIPDGGTWDASKLLSDITGSSQNLYDGQALYLVGGTGNGLNGVANVYHGCTIYPPGDTYANQDISNAAPAANSASIIANFAGTGNFDYGDNAHGEAVNLATNATTLVTVQAQTGGHNPPMTNGAGTQVPWLNGFYIEGTDGQTGTDGHAQVLNTQTCGISELTQTLWTAPSGPLSAYGGMNVSGTTSFSSQYSLMGPITVAYIPILGFTDYGEEASYTSINHPLSFLVPAADAAKISKYGYFLPSHNGYVSVGTCTTGNACLHLGDYIRLKASFNCSVYTTIGQLVCNQLKRYGAVFDDDDNTVLGFRFGLTTSGTNPWNYTTNLQPLFQALNMSDFDVIEHGTLQCTPGGGCV